jgi:hypothetical protein
VPFIRHTRDKRGFESLYVMHAYRPTPEAPHRTRVLYLFRSPTQLRVGRQPLDNEVMEALEHTHPDVSFDWASLTRERTPPHLDFQERPVRRPGSPRPSPPMRQTPSDDSVLACVLGAGPAAALRRRYLELTERVTRRARTPEERERLAERLKRLNPDEWADEAAVQTASRTIHADLSAISAELPGRRRGRRGGRRREAPPSPPGAPAAPSAIIDEDGPHHEAEGSAPMAWPDADAPDSGDGRDGTNPDAAPEPAEASGLHDDDRADYD